MADLSEIDQQQRDGILYAMVEGLHAMVYGTYTIGSGDYALRALGDGGSIHEYIHKMLLLLPDRCYEQIQSGGITNVGGQIGAPVASEDAATGIANLPDLYISGPYTVGRLKGRFSVCDLASGRILGLLPDGTPEAPHG